MSMLTELNWSKVLRLTLSQEEFCEIDGWTSCGTLLIFTAMVRIPIENQSFLQRAAHVSLSLWPFHPEMHVGSS